MLFRSIKTNKSSQNIEILTDDNTLIHKYIDLPEPPKNWDILALQYNVKNYIFNNTNSNIHWCKLQVFDTKHFIINNNKIDNILNILKQCKTWNDFIESLNNLNFYGITQSFISENSNCFIQFPYDKYNCKKTTKQEKDEILLNYSKNHYDKLKLLNIPLLDWNKSISYFDSKILNKTPTEKYILFPKISIICIISNLNNFIHSLHTFLKLDYPIDKLELIIIDHLNIEKRVKRLIPNDKRIKIINLQNKNSQNENFNSVPLGYLLNLGAKYATNDLIFHLFDKSMYFPDTFRNIIKCYLLSGKELIIGDKEFLFDKKNKTSLQNNTYNISNMMYSKKYWLVNMFKEIDDPNVILYKFMSFRTNTICKIPSLYCSFQLIDNNSTNIWSEKSEININLENLITDKSIKESYTLI